METLFYILIALAYFIYQIIKETRKAKERQEQQEHHLPEPQPSPHDPVVKREAYEREQAKRMDRRERQEPVRPANPTLDDMLREMQRSQKEAERKLPPAKKETVKRDGKLFSSDRMKPEVGERKLANSRKEPVIEVPQELPEHKRKKKVSPYVEMFKDPVSVRKAFIASEIFNRKYS